MDNKYTKILSDYNNCIDIPSCDVCEAWKTIEDSENTWSDSETTWCEFLRERDKQIRDRIEKALEG